MLADNEKKRVIIDFENYFLTNQKLYLYICICTSVYCPQFPQNTNLYSPVSIFNIYLIVQKTVNNELLIIDI